MSLNSVNTNLGAMVALQSLNRTNEALNTTQKRVSTGYRVSDAKDDGAAFAVAQSVRADVAGLTAANEQLGGVKGVLDTALAGLRKVSDTMIKVRETLVRLADDTLNTDQRAQYEAQYEALRTQITNFIQDSTYNGRTLLSTTAPEGGDITTTRNEAGTTYTLTAVDGAGTMIVATAPTDAAAALLRRGRCQHVRQKRRHRVRFIPRRHRLQRPLHPRALAPLHHHHDVIIVAKFIQVFLPALLIILLRADQIVPRGVIFQPQQRCDSRDRRQKQRPRQHQTRIPTYRSN